MLRSLKELQGYKVLSLDGPIGRVHEFYLDDDNWIIRYLIADLGTWLSGRKVLISPAALSSPDWEAQMFPLKLTKQEIENSPDIDTNMPISRQQEIDLHQHYNWPVYWTSGSLLLARGIAPHPGAVQETEQAIAAKEEQLKEKEGVAEGQGDPNLRSTREVIGYHIQATDGEFGHVEDFIVDDNSWIINYIVVDTKNWLPSKKVLIPPYWVEDISWLEGKVYFDLSQETIKNSPEYDPSAAINKTFEAKLYDYYGRPKN